MKFSRIHFALAAVLGLSLIPLAPGSVQAYTEVPAQFNVSGSGFGHGVGMSQYGAYGMAKNNFQPDQILKYYYQGTEVSGFDFASTYTSNGAQKSFENIRVSVQGDDSIMYLRFENNPQNPVTPTAPSITVDGISVANVEMNVDYTFTLTGTSFNLTGGLVNVTGTKALITWDNSAALANVNYGVPGSSSWGMLGTCSTTSCPHRYKYGTFEIFVSTPKPGVEVSQDLQAVNELKLATEYLYGLGEMPSSWDVKALAAQAVAARSYALKKVKAFPNSDRDDCGCHIFSDTSDQNFVGFSKEYFSYGQNWKDGVNWSVNGTTAPIITFSGEVIAGHYSSSSGGMTQPAVEWSGTAYPYEVSVDDRWAHIPEVNNPRSSWNVTVDQATLVSRFRNYGVAVTDIASIAITGKYASGGVSELTITDSLGTPLVIPVGPGKAITPDRLRTTFGAYSSYFSAINVGAGVQPGTATPPTPKVKIKSITNLKWPSTSIVPGSTFVTGKVSPVQSGVQVQLQVLQRSKWVTVATDTTGPQGIWKTTWSGINAGTYKMRVIASTPLNSIKTSTRSLKSVGSVSIGGPKSVARGGTISVGGSVKAAVEGIPILVQMKVGGGAWKSVATITTDSAGNWGFSTAASAKKNTTQFRVKTTDGRVGKLTSKTIRVAVK